MTTTYKFYAEWATCNFLSEVPQAKRPYNMVEMLLAFSQAVKIGLEARLKEASEYSTYLPEALKPFRVIQISASVQMSAISSHEVVALFIWVETTQERVRYVFDTANKCIESHLRQADQTFLVFPPTQIKS